jgi:putative zinc finger protein
MERAPLRPVPSRPRGAVDPDAAIRHVAAALPALDEAAAQAFGLVALAGKPRAEAAIRAGLPESDLGEALARARKTLRRSAFPLPGSGWCERAERLVSDRLDGALVPPGPARLDAHLRNCPRCVEHERRLVQATDSFVADFASVYPAPVADAAPAPPASADPPLSVVRHARAAAPAVRPFGEPVRPAPARVRRGPVAPTAVTSTTAPEEHEPRSLSAVAWSVLFALAVMLALAALALAVSGALGVPL